ncbi:MAG: hypothetical protein N3B13_04990 [Deltaproteobacteria bacterium]|nr:hypothetical protein [Deltaproteobacteria bacterium]
MNSILVAKVETDPLVHYGGIFNTLEMLLFLSLISFLLFLPFIRDGRYRNFLFFISFILPLLNVYYRNNNPFVGGVFLGHLFFIAGVLLISFLAYYGSEQVNINTGTLLNKKVMLSVVLAVFAIRAFLLFGSRPTDSGIFSGVGGILYYTGSSMFRDYWGVVSIGSRYGPMLYLAYLPFVPIGHVTKYLLWGDALSPWDSVSDVPLAVAVSYSGALFYEGLIVFILTKSFKRYGYLASLLYILNPLNSLILSVNANELPQTAFFLAAIYFLRRPVVSSLLFVLSSLMKIYPLVVSLPFAFFAEPEKRKKSLLFVFLFFVAGFIYWLFEASLSPPELRTNPIRDIMFYQADPGPNHSLWNFTDLIFGKGVSVIIVVLLSLAIISAVIYLCLRRRNILYLALRLSLMILAVLIIVNRSPHPGYYYFIQTLLFYLFFCCQEEHKQDCEV